jgi:hypothetical protein
MNRQQQSPQWTIVIQSMPIPAIKDFFGRVQRTRKRFIQIGFNGRIELVQRATVRDYLRELIANREPT